MLIGLLMAVHLASNDISKYKLRVWVISVLFALLTENVFAENRENMQSTDTGNCSDQEENDLRVRGTSIENVGHLEICHERIWGLICANHWTLREARVACRQVTGAPAREAIIIDPVILRKWNETGFYIQDQGPETTWLDYVYCTEIERRLIDCRHFLTGKPLKETYLGAGQRLPCIGILQRAGVSCRGPVNISIPSTTVSVPSSSTRIIPMVTTTVTHTQPSTSDRGKAATKSTNMGDNGDDSTLSTPDTTELETSDTGYVTVTSEDQTGNLSLIPCSCKNTIAIALGTAFGISLAGNFALCAAVTISRRRRKACVAYNESTVQRALDAVMETNVAYGEIGVTLPTLSNSPTDYRQVY